MSFEDSMLHPIRLPQPLPPPSAITHTRYYTRPWPFYLFSLLIPWGLWAVAAVISHASEEKWALWSASALGLLGLFAPVAVAWAMIRNNTALRADLWARLGKRGLTIPTVLLALLLLPITLLAAIGISVLTGGNPEQFAVNTTSEVMIGVIPGIITVTLAPFIEELAWKSYGTDSLTTRWTLWRSTWIFAIFWFFWHVPLSAIKGSYQSEVVEVGLLASVNFMASVLPFLIIMNWLYYRSHRNIWIAILLHLSANLGNEYIAADPDTKVYQTLVLIPVCAAILLYERRAFFTSPKQQLQFIHPGAASNNSHNAEGSPARMSRY